MFNKTFFKRLAIPAAVASLTLTALTPAQAALDLELIESESKALESKVIQWRRHLHENPELSNQELKTAAYIAKHLKALGFDEVQEGVAKTGVVGVLVGGKPGPVVALRSDMDALPVTEETGLPFASKVKGVFKGNEVGVMHACGHDGHMSILMGVAELLAKHRKDLPGTVKFIFQPAEEGMEGIETWGAKQMVEEGVLKGKYAPEVIFGLHIFPFPAGSLAYRAEGFMAAQDRFELTIQGKQTHGSAPWSGVDPITAAGQVVTAIQLIPARQLPITEAPAVVSVGSIHGGVRNNIIPDKVDMEGTIRTYDVKMRETLHKNLHRTVENISAASGATADLKIVAGYPVTFNDVELTRQMLPTLERVSPGKVMEIKPITAAEDFSYFQQQIPGLFIGLGAGKPGAAYNHSPKFDLDESALKTGVKVLSTLTVDYMNSKKN